MKNKWLLEHSRSFRFSIKKIPIFIQFLKKKLSKSSSDISVDSDEYLARFIIFSKWIRNSDKTVKPDAFIPHPYVELSVTRHSRPKNLSKTELWAIGERVALSRKPPATLYGRADIQTEPVRRQNLEVIPNQIEWNPNHANIIRWPSDKALQKSIAQQLSAVSRYIPKF